MQDFLDNFRAPLPLSPMIKMFFLNSVKVKTLVFEKCKTKLHIFINYLAKQQLQSICYLREILVLQPMGNKFCGTTFGL